MLAEVGLDGRHEVQLEVLAALGAERRDAVETLDGALGRLPNALARGRGVQRAGGAPSHPLFDHHALDAEHELVHLRYGGGVAAEEHQGAVEVAGNRAV